MRRHAGLSSVSLHAPAPWCRPCSWEPPKPEYLWQFGEWREQDLTGGLKLVSEPFHDRRGGYVLDIWDLLGPTAFGYPATLSVAV